MKNIFKIIPLMLLLVFLTSCEDDNESEIPGATATALELIDPQLASVVINPNTPNNPAFSLAWNDDIGAGAPYTIEYSSDLFQTVSTLGTSDTKTFSITQGELNSILFSAGLAPYTNLDLEIRVTSGSESSNKIGSTFIIFPDTPPVITSPSNGDAIVLDVEMQSEVAATVTWTDFDFETSQTTVNYDIQLVSSGGDFYADGIVAGSVQNATEISWTNSDLNTAALSTGIAPEETGDVDLRVKASINDGELVRYSDPITLTITTYELPFGNQFLVGSATAPGWNNDNNNPPLFRDESDPSLYHFTGRFNQNDSFKTLETRGSWTPQWGTNDGSTLAVNDGTGSDPNVFGTGSSSSGYFTFTMDINDAGNGGSFTIEPYDSFSDPIYGSVAIIGSGTPNGWDAPDTDMTRSSFDPHLWFIQGQAITDGEMKFRANDAWDVNWGDDSPELYGQGTFGGPNIPVAAGTYDIWFNDITGRYILVEI